MSEPTLPRPDAERAEPDPSGPEAAGVTAPAKPEPPAARAVASELLGRMVVEVRAAAARVAATGRRRPAPEAETDAEAIHDFRVALRRLRTLLRIVRRLYGKKRVAAIAADLKTYADVSGSVRDEEVLRETLADLELDPAALASLGAWVERRRRRERTQRGSVVRLLRAPPAAPSERERGRAPRPRSLERALSRLEKRLARPGKKGVSATELAREALASARADVREHAGADAADGLAMHLLRIRFKRLRYTAELLGGFVEEAAATAKGAAKMQKRLGELHDIDEALARIGRAWGLPVATREAVLAALRAARQRSAERARTDLAAELGAWARAEAAAAEGGAPRLARVTEDASKPRRASSPVDGAA